MAGALAFIIDFLLLYILTDWFGIHYLLSNLISYSVGLVIVFILNIKWVFGYRKYGKVSIELSIFSLIAIVGLLLSELLIWLMVELLLIDYLYAKVASAGFIFIFNYFLRKILLFSPLVYDQK